MNNNVIKTNFKYSHIDIVTLVDNKITTFLLNTSKVGSLDSDINTLENITLSLEQILDYIKEIGIIIKD